MGEATQSNLPLSVLEQSGDDSEQTGGSSGTLEQVEEDLQTARVELLSAQERLAALRPARRSVDPEVDRQTAATREQYSKTREELEVARLRFTPTHPEVRRLENILKTLGDKLGADPASPPRVLTAEEEREYQELVALESRQRARVRDAARPQSADTHDPRLVLAHS